MAHKSRNKSYLNQNFSLDEEGKDQAVDRTSPFAPPVGPQDVLETSPVPAPGEPERPAASAVSPVASAAAPAKGRAVGGGNLGGVQGYDAAKFADPNVQSLKYRAGRILSDYPTTSEGIRAAMQDPRWLSDAGLAGATYGGKDVINFHGELSDGTTGVPVNEVDVLQAFEGGGSASPFQWIDIDAALREQGGGGVPGGFDVGFQPDDSGLLAALTAGGGLEESDLMARIQAELQKLLAAKAGVPTAPGSIAPEDIVALLQQPDLRR